MTSLGLAGRTCCKRSPKDFPRRIAALHLKPDIYVHHDETIRARTQLLILARSDSVAAVRELARHLLVESAAVQPPKDPETLKNERYAG